MKFVNPAEVLQYWTVDGIPKVIDGNGYYDDFEQTALSHGKLTAGVKDSTWTGKDYDPDITFTEIYDKGKFISGISTDENGVKHPYDVLFINPKSKKGIDDFYSHISGNIRTEDISGKIIVHFFIETDGSVKEIKILKGLDKMHDQEVIRIVRNYRHWNCAEFRGIKRRAGFTLPITIR